MAESRSAQEAVNGAGDDGTSKTFGLVPTRLGPFFIPAVDTGLGVSEAHIQAAFKKNRMDKGSLSSRRAKFKKECSCERF